MSTVSLSALATPTVLLGGTVAAKPDTTPQAKKPKVCAAFVRPDVNEYWMGWPGKSYDIKGHQDQYTQVLTDAAKEKGVDLTVKPEPIHDRKTMSAFLAECKDNPPDGIVLTTMSLNASWPETDRFVAERPPEIPTIVYSPMGTSFTGHLQATRSQAKTLVAATQDAKWLAEGIHMLKTISDMRTSRLCIVNGEKTEDKILDLIGTTLHYVPLKRWEEELAGIGETAEMKELAKQFESAAAEIREPNAADVFESAKNYFVAKQIMDAEKCDGISLNCLGLLQQHRIRVAPCMAWMMLNDEGSVGCCECDWNAAISLRLCALLTGRPGFMQDPAPNTIEGTLMGAHCSSPARLRGFDADPEPVILRNHSESALGVSPQVLWPVGEPVTLMKFEGPKRIILGTGKVVTNIDTPPSGGCRTSLEVAVDDKEDPRDCRGFHQLFICGKFDRLFKNYCELAGIEVVPI